MADNGAVIDGRHSIGIDSVKELSQIRVCFLAGTLAQGGAERQLYHMLGALCRAGAALRVLCLTRNEFWEESIRELGVPVTWIGQGRSKLGRLFRIVAELRRDPPSIIQSQHFFMNAYAGVAARWLGVASIGALRSNGLMELRDCGWPGGWVNLRAPGVLAANSTAAMRYVAPMRRPDRLYQLSNVVDTVAFAPAASRSAGSLRLIAVGRLVQSKRFDHFISLLACSRQQCGCPVSGIILGDGPMNDQLRAQASGLGLTPTDIEFCGCVADTSSVYRRADVLVMTSEYEGTPNVLLEAMACGLPVVASKVGGVPEMVQHGQNGFLVDCGDEAGYRVALERLSQDAQLLAAMGQRARAYVQEHHSLDRLPGMLAALYEKALANACVRNMAPALVSHLG